MQPQTIKASRATAQPLHVLQIEDALLKIQTVISVTGLSESSIRRKVSGGNFPQPVKDGVRCTRWVAGDVTNWLRSMGGKQVVTACGTCLPPMERS